MYHVSTVPLSELNQHFICGLCFGYIIDATTIIECPHSFCRSCLVRYLTTENCCPLCGQLVHKTKPLDYIRTDEILQDLAYKLIPNLYKSEWQRRFDFRSSLGETESSEVDNWSDKDRGRSTTLDTSDVNERLSVCLQLADARQPSDYRAKIRSNDRRYLLCPAYLSVSVLKKFIHIKFELSTKHRIAMFYADEDLPDHYTLTDVAALYGWRRLCPLKLFYIVYNPSGLRHFVPDRTSVSYIMYRKLIKKHRHRHLKRVFHDDDQKDQTVPVVPSEPAKVSGEHQNLPHSAAEDTIAAESVGITSSSSVSDTPPVNSCTAVVSRSSFSIMRLLSLSEDSSGCENAKIGPDAGDDVRKLSKSLPAVGHSATESVAACQDQSAPVGGLNDSQSLGLAEVKPVPVHFKKRMLSSATVSQSASVLSEPAVIGKSVTPRRSFTIHQDVTQSESTPPAKVGIVISHGKAMTLQDKMQMTTNVGRRSPTSSSGRSLFAESAASPLRALNRHATPATAPHCKLKRRPKRVVKRSLIPSPKASGGNENETRHTNCAGDAKRPCRKSSKRSELELLLQLDGGTLAASAEFRKANALRARDNILPDLQPSRPSASAAPSDVIKTSPVAGPLATVDRTEDRTCL